MKSKLIITMLLLTSIIMMLQGCSMNSSKLGNLPGPENPTPTGGGDVILKGRVVDSDGNPVKGARLNCPEKEDVTCSSDGSFTYYYNTTKEGEIISITAEGYESTLMSVSITHEIEGVNVILYRPEEGKIPLMASINDEGLSMPKNQNRIQLKSSCKKEAGNDK